MTSLVHEVVAAHGGERWTAAQSLRMRVRVGGPLLAARGRSPFLRAYDVHVDCRRVSATLQPIWHWSPAGRLEANDVTLFARDTTRGARHECDRQRLARRRRWTDEDLVYFLGYALWNYAATPFIFLWTGFACEEVLSWQEPSGEQWRRLRVLFPVGFPTHSREQVFYFDHRHLLRRLDYMAEVVSPWARAAHYCDRHRTFEGLTFPTRRRVYWRRRNGRPVRWLCAMRGYLDGVAIE